MYAQGLQMGQALRNMVLDPANPKARENLNAAQAAYDKAYKETASTARDTAFETPINALAALRTAHGQAQDKVISALAIDVPEAIKTLNASETPAWRQLRAELLKQVDASTKVSEQTHQEVQANANRATLIGHCAEWPGNGSGGRAGAGRAAFPQARIGRRAFRCPGCVGTGGPGQFVSASGRPRR
jgi:hypothetical protein